MEISTFGRPKEIATSQQTTTNNFIKYEYSQIETILYDRMHTLLASIISSSPEVEQQQQRITTRRITTKTRTRTVTTNQD